MGVQCKQTKQAMRSVHGKALLFLRAFAICAEEAMLEYAHWAWLFGLFTLFTHL